jgi:hypothetical protein
VLSREKSSDPDRFIYVKEIIELRQEADNEIDHDFERFKSKVRLLAEATCLVHKLQISLDFQNSNI